MPHRGRAHLVDRLQVHFLKTQGHDDCETHEFRFVRAGYAPNKPTAEQSNTTLEWESVQPDRLQPQDSGKTVFAGHSPQTSGEPLDLAFMERIDTDCSRGAWLTGLEVRSGGMTQTDQDGQIQVVKQLNASNPAKSETVDQHRSGAKLSDRKDHSDDRIVTEVAPV